MSIHTFLSSETPLLDVRSPQEYRQGHFPGAVSFPLFTDEERALVGTSYKKEGKEAAVRLGLAIVGPKLVGFIEEAERISNGSKSLRVYCWRGGMRSGSMAWLLTTAGYSCQVLEGGYKAFRRWSSEIFARSYNLMVVGGLTGSGKTERLQLLKSQGEQVVDLEALAGHRGSSFGHLGLGPQPTCEHFSNLLASELSRMDPSQTVWVEDESRMIGSCQIPQPFWEQMCSAKMVWIEATKEERVERLIREYGEFNRDDLISAVKRIERRLGGAKTKMIIELISQGNIEAITGLLDYYDRAYLHTCEKHPRQRTDI
jgi:tRNA 2-selenouridine synthase